jgi:hypothetical protein
VVDVHLLRGVRGGDHLVHMEEGEPVTDPEPDDDLSCLWGILFLILVVMIAALCG